MTSLGMARSLGAQENLDYRRRTRQYKYLMMSRQSPSFAMDPPQLPDMPLAFPMSTHRVASIPLNRRHFLPATRDSVSNKQYPCSYCLRRPGAHEHFKQCSRCHRVAYCSKACQKTSWPCHK